MIYPIHGLWLRMIFVLSLCWFPSLTYAQIPPLNGTNPFAPTQKKKTARDANSVQDKKKLPPLKKNPLTTAHGRYVFAWGRKFQKKLPRGWRMDWDTTSLRDIKWQSGPQIGHQIRFVHETKKVPVPVPFPDFRPGSKNTVIVPLRCTLHFFPLQGTYRAYDNRVNRMTPARIVAVLKKAIVMLPDRFLAKEFPCPSILQRFRRFTRSSRRGRRAPRSWHRTLKRMGFPRVKIRRFRHHVSLAIQGAKKPLPWKKLLKSFRKPTLVVRFQDRMNRWITIYHR